MKKIIKIVGIVLLSIMGVYTIFVVEESIRLSKDSSNKPLIILKETNIDKSVDDTVCYDSIGFKLVNKYGLESSMVGQEFWLFDTFMLWGWIS